MPLCCKCVHFQPDATSQNSDYGDCGWNPTRPYWVNHHEGSTVVPAKVIVACEAFEPVTPYMAARP